MQNKLYLVYLEKSSHLSNIIDPIEPRLFFFLSIFLLFSFSQKSNLSVERRCAEYTSQLSTWWHGWHDWETLLCTLLV